ncbi:MAG: hypothetical protein QHH14_07575 [Clostridiales bacterium]|nr:hypothetical protein [Clostridiales bacterium]
MKTANPLFVLLATALILCFGPSCKSVSPDEIKNSVVIEDVETKWVAKVYQPWPPKLILVPSFSFRVKNVSDKPLNYLNFNAIFKFKDELENLGDNFLAAIRKDPIMPGEKSHVITLKSNFGVEGKTLASFKDNPQWKIVICRLFIQSKGSPHILLGEYEISRTIDFKEPEPVGIKKKED